jgi:hypothetical protein
MIAARLLSMIDYQQTAERNGRPVASRRLIGFFLRVKRAEAQVAKLRPRIDVDQSATCVLVQSTRLLVSDRLLGRRRRLAPLGAARSFPTDR